MKIIAVTNIKGGVGKTTTAVNLAYLCAASGQRTLLWDLDPQGGATYVLGIEPDGHEFSPNGRAAPIYAALWEEVSERMGQRTG